MKFLIAAVLSISVLRTDAIAQNAKLPSARRLAVLATDTVKLIVTHDSNYLTWRRGSAKRTWKSPSLSDATPRVKLAYVGSSGSPALFFTIGWEDFIQGELWVGTPSAERRVFKSGDDACRVPELRDLNADGRLDLIDWKASGLKVSECSGDIYGGMCLAAYPVSWPEVWIQRPSGEFVRDSVAARSFYATQAVGFERGVKQLRKDIAAKTGAAAKSPRCNEQLAKELDRMKLRAKSIAALR